MSLRLAWDVWLLGYPNNRSKVTTSSPVAPVRPLRFIITNKLLPAGAIRNGFTSGWNPILRVMHVSAKRQIDLITTKRMNAEFRIETYSLVMQDIRAKRPHLFEGENESKWSRKVRGY